MSLEVEVAGTALVGGTWASIRPTPASKCMVQTTTGGANAEAMPTRSQGGRERGSLKNFSRAQASSHVP
jgi:hypothetical protein